MDVFETVQLERGYDNDSGGATQGYHYACVTDLGTPGDGDGDCVPVPPYHMEAQWLLAKNSIAGTVPVHSCVRPNERFVSTDAGCNGVGDATDAGVVAYIFTSPEDGVTETETLKLCLAGVSYFLSSTANCEGQTTVAALGYALGNY